MSYRVTYESINAIVVRQDGNRSRVIRVWKEESPGFDPINAKREVTDKVMNILGANTMKQIFNISAVELAERLLDCDQTINAVQVSDGAVEMGVVVYRNWP